MAGVKAFLLDVRAKNPNAEIIYAYGMMSAGWMSQIKSVVNELRAAGDTHITFLKLDACTASEKGIASHPTAESYISRGDALIELITQLTGWKADGGASEETEPPVETTEAPVETTSAPEATEPPVVTEPEVTEPAPEKKGCGASAMSAAAVVGAVAAAVALKKKKED